MVIGVSQKTVVLFMKIALLVGLALTANIAVAGNLNADKIADAIYVIEGGNKTKYPYGIKSINTHGNAAKARRICINTIKNTHKRWIAANKPIDFLDYLANRYCPSGDDKIGNQRWKRNIRKFLIIKR